MKVKEKEKIEIDASSRSMELTIKELDALFEGKQIANARGKLRAKLHDTLFRLLRQKARRWYQRGFRRGHEAARKKSKRVPSELRQVMRMKAAYLPKGSERIVLKSKLKP